MTTVDIVIAGATADAVAAAIDAAGQGNTVLVVIRTQRAPFTRLVRKRLAASGQGWDRQITVIPGAEIVCVDGVNAVEAVVIRHLRTGRLVGVNTSALMRFDCPA